MALRLSQCETVGLSASPSDVCIQGNLVQVRMLRCRFRICPDHVDRFHVRILNHARSRLISRAHLSCTLARTHACTRFLAHLRTPSSAARPATALMISSRDTARRMQLLFPSPESKSDCLNHLAAKCQSIGWTLLSFTSIRLC